MGQGEETKTKTETAVEIQERGEIYFFYRPKVDKEEAHGEEDVQRLYLVLRPESGESETEEKKNDDKRSGKKNHVGAEPEKADDDAGQEDQEGRSEKVNIEKQTLMRLIVMGRKSLPDVGEKKKKTRPYWGFVEMVTTDVQHIKDALKGEEYETKTRGHRHLPDSRALGEGVYRILRHNPSKTSNKMHTHLVYKLEFPPEGSHSEPQEALNISREASFLIQIKNPNQQNRSGFRGLQSKRKASFPAHMQALLGHNRFHPADPPDFLNYEGCEFLLISASDDIEDELGLELKTEQEREGLKVGDVGSLAECSDLVKTFGENASGYKAHPLLRGTWV